MTATDRSWTGYLAMVGGAAALLLAPPLVAIKYMTGWNIIPEPLWVPSAKRWLSTAFPDTTPAELWMVFGTPFSLAILLMMLGLIALGDQLRGNTRTQRAGYWLVLGGLALVLPGDAIHTWTWHWNGLTTPTPGTNPVANTAYAVHMMGMNFVMAGSLMLGITALRRRTLARWAAWLVTLVFPAALLASVVLLPTTPSGALWLFSLLMTVFGYLLARGRAFEIAER
ncbi:MAG: hypothetical protein ACT4OZ_17265 [Gemmatimonadota bacterium]